MTPTRSKEKEQQRAEIERATAEFLAADGKIQRLSWSDKAPEPRRKSIVISPSRRKKR